MLTNISRFRNVRHCLRVPSRVGLCKFHTKSDRSTGWTVHDRHTMKQQAIASIKSKKSLPTGKYVYVYGDQFSEGDASMKALLGGKGANLAEMNRVGIPVPPGFTLTTEVTA